MKKGCKEAHNYQDMQKDYKETENYKCNKMTTFRCKTTLTQILTTTKMQNNFQEMQNYYKRRQNDHKDTN